MTKLPCIPIEASARSEVMARVLYRILQIEFRKSSDTASDARTWLFERASRLDAGGFIGLAHLCLFWAGHIEKTSLLRLRDDAIARSRQATRKGGPTYR